MKEIISYAQNREDIIISAFFPDVKKGFYVDVGANDPIDDSVTKYFYDKGWSGINIEPIKKLHSKLEKDRGRDKNLNIGISSKPGKLTLREYKNHGISTFSNLEKQENRTDEYKDYDVEVQTLEWVFKKVKVKKINFLKIDVEGYEYEVLEGNDWDKFRPELICIESNHMNKDWRPILNRAKYEKVFFDGLNGYYLAAESEKRLLRFEKMYPRIIISAPILDIRWKRLIDKTEEQLEKVQSNLEAHIDLNEKTEVASRQLNIELSKFQEIGYTTRHLLKLTKNKVKREKRDS